MVNCSKTEDIDFDDESRKKKKKKMLDELFGSNEEKKTETKPLSTPSQSKSDWLELKDDSPEETLLTDFNYSTKAHGYENEPRVIQNTSSTIDRMSSKTAPEVSERTVHFADNSGTSGRRKSESSPTLTKKSKPRFKSLDLNLDFDFDSTSQDELATKPGNTSATATASVEAGKNLKLTEYHSEPMMVFPIPNHNL